ncbi:uncharacterized protein BDZ83DRAFT_431144 [Colletotrichum acutatum]|uniref:Uncharacterized protein n=1 Tax=Glomerella acutata TaxID=27357 RepID=A0AAD8XF09_GLOAC|nr:uncharacterized protein BDZ83DRAFT_431144 [Colletotrichum acutatum]KAK1722338.1 hypothetical protein BDZ83DRAFT_431144 [Colletotrichum acutatum]
MSTARRRGVFSGLLLLFLRSRSSFPFPLPFRPLALSLSLSLSSSACLPIFRRACQRLSLVSSVQLHLKAISPVIISHSHLSSLVTSFLCLFYCSSSLPQSFITIVHYLTHPLESSQSLTRFAKFESPRLLHTQQRKPSTENSNQPTRHPSTTLSQSTHTNTHSHTY